MFMRIIIFETIIGEELETTLNSPELTFCKIAKKFCMIITKKAWIR